MSKKSRPHKTTETTPAEPPAWRTAATVVLLLHLLCLGIALVSNAGQESPFRQALRNVPLATDYLQALSMDRAYDFPLAGALPQDSYHRLVLIDGTGERDLATGGATNDANGKAAGQMPRKLPSASMPLGVRRQRYERLAFWISQFNETFGENLDLKTQLPHAVARRWLAERGTPSGNYELLCQRILPKRWRQSVADDPNAQSPNTDSASTKPTNAETGNAKQPNAKQSNAGGEETLDLRLLWEKESQDLLVSLREEPSQLAAVVSDETVKGDAAEVGEEGNKETNGEKVNGADTNETEADERSEQE